jgi:PAS domain S-box-containing protein
MHVPDISRFLSETSAGFLTFGSARMALLDLHSGFWGIRRQIEALIGPRLTNSVLQQAGANGGASFSASFGEATEISEQGLLFEGCVQAYQAAGFGHFTILEASWPIGRLIVRAENAFEAWMTLQHQQQVTGPVCAYTAGVLVGFINMISGRRDVVCIEHRCQAAGDEACEFELLPISEAGDRPVVSYTPDPMLGRQLNLLEMLFERMPMSIVVLDREYRLVRFNPTWAAFIDRYTPSHAWQVLPGAYLFDLEPGTEGTFLPLFERAFQGETVRQESVRMESGGMVSHWDIVISPLYEGDQIVGLLGVAIDVSERVQAEQKLTETLARLAESESMLRSVIENARHFAVYRVQVDPSNPYYGKVALASPSLGDLAGVEDPYDFASWFTNLHPEDAPRIIEANRRSLEERAPYNQSARFFNKKEDRWRWVHTISNPAFDPQGKLTHFDGMVIDLTEQREAELALKESERTLATLIRNLPGMAYRCRNDYHWTMEFVSEGSLELTGHRPGELVGSAGVHYGDLIHPEDQAVVWNKVQSALHEGRLFQMTYRIRTLAGEKWVWEQGQGVTSLDGDVVALEGFITDISERVTAQQNLEQRVSERTRELSTLLEISHNLASTLELEPLLDLILDQLGTVVPYDAASIMVLDGELLRIFAYRGPIARQEALHIRFSIHEARANQEVILHRAPIIVADILADEPLAYAIRQTAGVELESTYSYLRCWMGVPLIFKDRVIGMLTLDHKQPDYYTSLQSELAMAFASQAAVAIENARLFQQAEQAAVAHERNRLARDLHDAVSQTLFSASLIADVLPKLWEQHPEMGKRKLAELRLLTRGALSEMRTLLLELRPDAFRQVDLGDLYRHLGNAFTGRTNIPVTFTQRGETALSLQVKEVFYRIGQEALNNIAKHAGASTVQIRFNASEQHAEIEIGDDGCGFEMSALSPENLGIRIMRERAETIRARLDVESGIGKGTVIRVCWQAEEENQ